MTAFSYETISKELPTIGDERSCFSSTPKTEVVERLVEECGENVIAMIHDDNIINNDVTPLHLEDDSFDDIHDDLERLENEYWLRQERKATVQISLESVVKNSREAKAENEISHNILEEVEDNVIKSQTSVETLSMKDGINIKQLSQNSSKKRSNAHSLNDNIKHSKYFCETHLCSEKISPKIRNADFEKRVSDEIDSNEGNHNLCESAAVERKNNLHDGVVEGSCLLSHIKETLKQNASGSSGAQMSFASVMRETNILNALEEVQKIQEQYCETDIGPFFGLPSKMKWILKQHRGISSLYEWQNECLSLSAIDEKRNLIYSLPTSGGKTLVAEILIMKELLCQLKNAIFVLPYISIVQEKVRGLSPFAVELDFVVEEYAGSKGSVPPRRRRRRHVVYICTIEKAHTIVNSLLENKRLDEIGLVVVDEIHMLGETGGRGAVLESLLSKVLYTAKHIQIIGMSATLSNMEDLQEFLHAEIYSKNFRPVELKEFVKVGNQLWEFNPKASDSENFLSFARSLNFDYGIDMCRKDPDYLMGLVMEVVPQNSCLIFCPTKKHCENVALMLCQLMPETLKKNKKEEKKSLYNALASEANGRVCHIFTRTVSYGVAYHHSGLTMDERKLIEEAYISGTLCCLTCTSTLAAGVNLPAKRVILRAPYIGRNFITSSKYKQMVGRAGRAGIDTAGESILIIKSGEEQNAKKLLTSPVESCRSCLLSETKGFQMLLLSLIGLEIATSLAEISEFINHTLLAVQCRQQGQTPTMIFKETVEMLSDNGLVTEQKHCPGKLVVTKLGRAAFKGGVDLSKAQMLSNDLREGLNGLTLHSHLHLLYLVTPVDLMDIIPISSDIYFQRYMALNPDDQRAAEHIGVSESLIVQLASGRVIKSSKKMVLHRFYLTLILYDLWQQTSIWNVSENYHLHRGVIQNLLSSASAFGASLTHFCQELDEFWAYQQLLPSFVKQLSYCVTMELLPLLELPAVKRGRARQLYAAGFRTLADVAKAQPKELVSKIDHMPKRVATQIVSAAKMLLLEKAEALQEEAEEMVAEFRSKVTVLS